MCESGWSPCDSRPKVLTVGHLGKGHVPIVTSCTPRCPTVETFGLLSHGDQPLSHAFPLSFLHDKETLEISTALANLAVTKDAIVAVATNLSTNNLQVVACTNSNADSREFDHSGKPSRDSIFSSWKLILSPNTRKNDPPSNTQHPTIVKTAIPSGVDPKDDETLLHYIKETW